MKDSLLGPKLALGHMAPMDKRGIAAGLRSMGYDKVHLELIGI